MGYKINNIDISSYGILPSQTTGSNLAISGFLDMPKRIGKTYHDWQDENGVEPYVNANEIFFGGRDITFKGILKANDRNEAIHLLRDFYRAINAFTGLVEFATDYGVFNVYVKEEIKVNYVNNGWAKLEIKFREPVVAVPSVTVPYVTGDDKYGIDGISFNSIGMFLKEVKNNMDRSQAKKQNVSVYGFEGFEITKTAVQKESFSLIAKARTMADLTKNIGILHKQLASDGLRNINIDTTSRQAWSVDGFSVKNIRVGSNLVVANAEVELLMINSNTGLLRNNEGIMITTNKGRRITINR